MNTSLKKSRVGSEWGGMRIGLKGTVQASPERFGACLEMRLRSDGYTLRRTVRLMGSKQGV